jgi:predicted nucleic acid-binding protein
VIILDTNVLSEMTRAAPEPAVLHWMDSRPASELATTAVTAAELWYGVARLADGRRKSDLVTAIDGLLGDDLGGRIAAFDAGAAAHYGVLVAEREASGLAISVADAQIAAICLERQAVLATRNTRDFRSTGIELVNPWAGR